MGLFDYVTVNDPRFVCSEGHDLGSEDFQSKDFGCEMGQVTIANGGVSSRAVCLGKPEADSDKVELGCTCRRCPAFVQFGTGNLIDCDVSFEVGLNGDEVTSVVRTSPATSDWLHDEPLERYMRRCEGPMPHADAVRLHIGYRELRPQARVEFEKWASARSKALQERRPWPLALSVGEYPDEES